MGSIPTLGSQTNRKGDWPLLFVSGFLHMEWHYFHEYRRLSEEGKVKHLSCPDCNNKLTTVLGTGDEPVLWCAVCDTLIKPGLDVYDQIRAVVKEHNV